MSVTQERAKALAIALEKQFRLNTMSNSKQSEETIGGDERRGHPTPKK